MIESFSYIHGAKLGENVKVLGHVFIPAGILIDHDSVIGPGVVFTNRKYPNKKCHGFAKEEPKADREWVTIVGAGVTIGAGSVIGSGIKIGDGAFIGMGSVVTKSVQAGAMVYGVPAKRKDIDEWGAPKRGIIEEKIPEWRNWNNDEIVKALEDDWTGHMEQRRTLHRVLKDVLKTLNGKYSGPKEWPLLDAGCGTCVSYPALRDIGYQYGGIDVTPKMIEKAREKFSDVVVQVRDILDLRMEDRSDVVLNCDVLLHTPTVKPYLEGLWRATRKVLVIKLSYVWNKPTRDDWDGKFYNRKFNLAELKDMFLKLDPVPKDVQVFNVDDDEKTSPEFSNAQIFVIWKGES